MVRSLCILYLNARLMRWSDFGAATAQAGLLQTVLAQQFAQMGTACSSISKYPFLAIRADAHNSHVPVSELITMRIQLQNSDGRPSCRERAARRSMGQV